jgi:polar amino acid transport system substrate-binding protein
MTGRFLLSWLSCAVLAGGIVSMATPGDAASLPDAVRQSGTIRISVNAIYPPMEYKDPATNQLIGLDIDLGDALAKQLGVKLAWSESAFEQLIPSLQTGRADLILSGISDLPARRETMDFVDYMQSGAQFYTLASSPARVEADLCGKRVGTSRSTSFPNEIRNWSAKNCEGAGKPAIEVVNAESTADARAQLKQGRIDAAVQGSETVPYVTGLEPGIYRVLGPRFSAVFQGIAFRKDDTGFRDAVADALAVLIKDGTYGRIMAKWALSANAVEAPTINGQPRP